MPIIINNWNEFQEKTPIGKKHGKKFIPTRKQNPKDQSPIRQLTEDIPNTEMFKEDYYYAIDRLHKDHLEVWNSKEKWIGASNFDGSKNEKIIYAVTDRHQRKLSQ